MAEGNVFDRIRAAAAAGKLDDVNRRPTLPTIKAPGETLESLRATVLALKQAVDTLQAGAINPLDKAITARDLMQSGMLGMMVGARQLGGSSGLIDGGGGQYTWGGETVISPGEFFGLPTLAVPPTPTNLRAFGTFKTVILTWDLKAYANHGYTEIWRASANNIALAVKIGTAVADLYVDADGITLGTTFYYWVRAVTSGSTPATGAYNSEFGTPAGAGQIGNADLGDLIIEARNLAENAVTAVKIEDNAITAGKLAANAIAVGSAAIENGAIAHAMIGEAAIEAANIADLAVETAKIADGAITTLKVGDGEITNAKIYSLDAAKITTGFLGADRIGAGSITAGKINGRNLEVMAGDFDGWAWPPSGGGGFYLGPNGLLLGNVYAGQYLQLNRDGSMSAPGFSLAGGSASFSGNITAGGRFQGDISGSTGTFSGSLTAQVVNTQHIVGAAVSSVYGVSSASNSVSMWMEVPYYSQNFTVIAFFGGGTRTYTVGGGGKDPGVTYTDTGMADGSVSASSIVAFDGGFSGTFYTSNGKGVAASVNNAPVAGNYLIAAVRSGLDSYTGPISLLGIVTRR